MFEGPCNIIIEKSQRFKFTTNNNHEEYKALIAAMNLSKEVDYSNLRSQSDSQLITSQVAGEYQTKEVMLIKYLQSSQGLVNHFKFIEVVYVPREENTRADLLSNLSSIKKPDHNRIVIHGTSAAPNIEK